MKHDEVTVGMKVVPHSKNYFGDLADSIMWNKAQELHQPYLYVIEIEDEYVVLGVDHTIDDGDFFLASDFEPYTEPTPEEPMSEQPSWTPCNPFSPTSDSPFPFDPLTFDPIPKLPPVYAYDEDADEWDLAFFMGHDEENKVFEVILQNSRLHKQTKFLSAYNGEDTTLTPAELISIPMRLGFPIAWDGRNWHMIEYNMSTGVNYMKVSRAWLYSVRA